MSKKVLFVAGDRVVAIRQATPVSWGGAYSKPSGHIGTVNATKEAGQHIKFSPYGDWFKASDFEKFDPIKQAESAVKKIDDQIAALNKKRLDAAAKVEALKNPPWKVGDRFRLGSAAIYVVHFLDNEVVTYKNTATSDFWSCKRPAFNKLALRVK